MVIWRWVWILLVHPLIELDLRYAFLRVLFVSHIILHFNLQRKFEWNLYLKYGFCKKSTSVRGASFRKTSYKIHILGEAWLRPEFRSKCMKNTVAICKITIGKVENTVKESKKIRLISSLDFGSFQLFLIKNSDRKSKEFWSEWQPALLFAVPFECLLFYQQRLSNGIAMKHKL